MSTFQNIDTSWAESVQGDLSARLPPSPLEKFIKSFENLVVDGLVQMEPNKCLSIFGSALQPELQQIETLTQQEKCHFLASSSGPSPSRYKEKRRHGAPRNACLASCAARLTEYSPQFATHLAKRARTLPGSIPCRPYLNIR